jgi:hypothetical protein
MRATMNRDTEYISILSPRASASLVQIADSTQIAKISLLHEPASLQL